jgi:hypothetical protein
MCLTIYEQTREENINMAAKYTVKTRDLRVQFFEKSFKIADHHYCVWTGRDIPHVAGREIADMMQELVERGRHPNNWHEFSRGIQGTIIDPDDEVSWQAQEICELKDKIQDLEQELLNNAWGPGERR